MDTPVQPVGRNDCYYDCAQLTVRDALQQKGLPDEVIDTIIGMTTKKEFFYHISFHSNFLQLLEGMRYLNYST